MSESINANEIISSRVFDAPIELVFQAWTNPEYVARWWGPNGFTNTFHEFELKPSGNWKFDMHGPDGTTYPNHIIFDEISPLKRIVLNHVSEPEFLITATFEDLGSSTKVIHRQLFKKTSVFEKVKSMCTEANEQNFDRFAEVLNGMTI
jgi:uncharacterized protein YndB with AHSA1/START domain